MDELRRSVSVRVMAAIGVAVVAAVAVACAPNPNDPGTTTTTTSTTMPWSDPVGVWSHFTMPCSANVFGMPQPFSQSASINVEAPVSVKQGATFEMMVAPGPFIIPANVSGYDLASLSDVAIRFPVSPNAQFVDSVLSAGKNMGPGYPSVKMEGTDLVYRVPGPFTPGATVQMPKVKLTFKATGPVGGGIDVRMTSMTSTATVSIISVPVSCTPNPPNPLFWSTSIKAA
ncbi:MAG: hypothetical protein V9E94_14355 [Microthrixaceae bacterium]